VGADHESVPAKYVYEVPSPRDTTPLAQSWPST
jgi:hypothetical protein